MPNDEKHREEDFRMAMEGLAEVAVYRIGGMSELDHLVASLATFFRLKAGEQASAIQQKKLVKAAATIETIGRLIHKSSDGQLTLFADDDIFKSAGLIGNDFHGAVATSTKPQKAIRGIKLSSSVDRTGAILRHAGKVVEGDEQKEIQVAVL